jgi:hypothetical protein
MTAIEYSPEYAALWGDQSPVALAEDALDRATGRDHSALFAYLYGDAQDIEHRLRDPKLSRSEVDLHFAILLATYATRDPALIAALMRESPLKRPKWQEQRPEGTILDRTVRVALRKAPDHTTAPTETGTDVTPSRWTLYTDEELLALPEPSWLLQDVLFAGGLTLLYGLKGTYKSFLALAWTYAVATGAAWLDRPSASGPVVYVVAEGKGFFRRRVEAIRTRLQLTGSGSIRFVTVPVNLFDGEAPAFAAYVREQLDGPPVLYVFDTLARSTAGAEENSNKDMGLVVQAAQLLQQGGAAVLLVHHTGKDGLDARGASALRNAADVVCKLVKTGERTVTLTWENTKDLKEPEPLGLVLEPSPPSLVVTAGQVVEQVAKDGRRSIEDTRGLIITACLREARTVDEIAGAAGLTTRTVREHVPVLIAAGRLKQEGGTGQKGDPFRYRGVEKF